MLIQEGGFQFRKQVDAHGVRTDHIIFSQTDNFGFRTCELLVLTLVREKESKFTASKGFLILERHHWNPASFLHPGE